MICLTCKVACFEVSWFFTHFQPMFHSYTPLKTSENRRLSNSKTVLQSLPQSTLKQKYVNLEFSLPKSGRALGLIWNIKKDRFTFKPIIKSYPIKNAESSVSCHRYSTGEAYLHRAFFNLNV